MELNYLAFFLISFLPLVIGYFWFHPKFFISKISGLEFEFPQSYKWSEVFYCFILSVTLIYGYINLIIHQMGFYELFFTDIMKGSDEAKQIVEEFLMVYGDKHRHFGHGVFHGVINAFVFALPFVGIHTILNRKSKYFLFHNFSFWLVTSAIVGGLISEFV